MDLGIIIQSFAVYGIMAILFYKLGCRYSFANCGTTNLNNCNGISFLVSIALIFALFSGLRYLTGSDTVSYVEQYELMQRNSNYSYDHFEEGWTLFCKGLIALGFNSAFYLAVVGLIQIGALWSYFKYKPTVVPYIALAVIITGEIFNLWNGLRQVTVAYLFFPLLFLIEDKKYIKFLIAVFFLSFFHKSAYLLLLFYPLFWYGKVILPHKYLQISILIGCVIIGGAGVWMHFMDYLDSTAQLLGYKMESDRVIDYIESFEKNNFGIRSFSKYFIVILTMLLSGELLKQNNDRRFVFYYNAFLIAILSDALFAGARVFNRGFYYAQPFCMIIDAFLLYYLFTNTNKSKRILGYILLLVFIVSIAASILTAIGDGTVLYKCILWDK